MTAIGLIGTAGASFAQTAAEPAPQAADLPPLEVTAKAQKKAAKKQANKPAVAKAAKKAPPPAAAASETPAEAGNGTSMQSANGPVDGYVAKNTGFGSKTNTPISQIPQSVSVVGRKEIDDQGAQKTDEALRYTAGVFAQPFGADSDTNWLFIRGFDATQTGIYQDGLQLYGYAFGAFYIDSFGLERIEVLKGASSVLYGGSNPGGLVNYVSKKPDGERHRYLEAGVNEFGTGYLGVDIGDRATSNLDYRITGRIQGGDGYSDLQDDGFRGFVNPTLTWHDEQTRLTLLGAYGHIDEVHNGGSFLPYVGTVVPASFGRIPREANYTEPKLDSYDREQGSFGYELEHKLASNLLFRQNARYGHADIEEVNVYPNGYASPTQLARVNFSHDTSVDTFLIDNQLEARAATGPVGHTVLAGIDYKYFNIDQVQSSAVFGTTTPINVINPIYGTVGGPRVPYLNQDLTQEQVGVYVQEQARFGGGWIVTLNGRYDWVHAESDDGPNFYAPTLNTTTESDDGAASGRAGLAYTFSNGVTPYASASTYFNPVPGTTAAGAFFKPEEGEQYEVGVKYVPTFMNALFTASLFDITRQNVLAPDPVVNFASTQTGEVTSKGIELEAKVNVSEQLKVTGAFTAYDLEITKGGLQIPSFAPGVPPTVIDLAGKRPVIVPEILASAAFDYTFRNSFLNGLSVGAGVRYYGSSPANQLNTKSVPDETLFDAKIGYDFGSWGVDLNVTNIFDEAYVASCQSETVCSYGESRVVKLKTHVTW